MTVHDFAARPNTYTEEDARVDLAALHRLYVHFGWTDLIYTHLTARVPGERGHYLIKPDHLMMDEVTASSLIKVDFDGNLVAGDAPPNQAGHLIHTAILAARPEITFTAHTHSRSGAAVSCLEQGILPLSQHANMVLPTVCYHDYQDVTSAEDECAALARDLGDKFLMVMKNHGLYWPAGARSASASTGSITSRWPARFRWTCWRRAASRCWSRTQSSRDFMATAGCPTANPLGRGSGPR